MASGITQKEFANSIGVNETTLRSWELNKRKPAATVWRKLEIKLSLLEPI